MKGTAKCYEKLREYVETISIVDCHDHTTFCEPKYTDPTEVVIGGYFESDLHSASSDKDMEAIRNFELPLEERWPILEKAWKRTCYTGYAQVTRRVLKKFYGEEDVTLDAMKRMKAKLMDLSDEKTFDKILGEANIVVRLQNIGYETSLFAVKDILNGTFKMSPRSKIVIPLPEYQSINNYTRVQELMKPLGKTTTSLDEYIAGCREIFEGFKQFGAVAMKNQTAYQRTIEFDNPPRADAERAFNWFIEDPRRAASYPDQVKPLEDFLFHTFMRMARDMDLPVQIHTGHMAGIRDNIVKTNAIGLTRVIELHRDVRFDLFHANWPYGGELLFLAKNHPNVNIDFCWANIIDPVYCQRLFKQIISTVPHGKIHGYGSDFTGKADRAWAHASIACDNISIALSDLVEIEYLGFDDAKQIAHEWLFSNPNKFFRLGL